MKTRIILFVLLSSLCICAFLVSPAGVEAEGNVTTLDAWKSRPLPAQSHQLPSWARGNYFYVHTFDGNIYRTSVSNGQITSWQNAGNYAGGPHGFVVTVADDKPYAFRNGHVIRYDINASNNIGDWSCLEWASQACPGAPGTAFDGFKYMWDSAVYVPLGSGYIFHLGGFNMTDHAYSAQTLHREALPVTAPVRFSPIGHVPTSKPYKAVFYKASDRYGFIYMGTLEGYLWRIRVNAEGVIGPWEVAHGFPQGENDRGDMFVVDDQLFIIRGRKVYQAAIDRTTGALSAWSDLPPDLSEPQVTVTWNATEPEPASYGIIGDYVCVTGTSRVHCAHIARSQLEPGLFLPLLYRFN